jgi:hypothetical protein
MLETSSSNDDNEEEGGQESTDTSDSNDGNDGQSTIGEEDDEAIVEVIVKKVVETLSASGILGSEH